MHIPHYSQPTVQTQRLNFAHEHKNWGPEEWWRVLFTDESWFCLRFLYGQERIWRRQNERFAQSNVAYHPECLLVAILIENGLLTADRDVDQCLADHVVP